MKYKKIYPIILSGGSGTRLWPESRLSFPKQFLKINSNYTLIQETLLRIKNKNIFHQPILICNDEHRFLISEQIKDLNIKPKMIVLEPIPRNTCPAIAVASAIIKRMDENGKILILPSDHKITNNKEFINSIILSREISEDKIVTFGIKPEEPDINFGYIKKGKIQNKKNNIFYVDKFKEKPSLNLAKKYLKNKNYFWNSGIFLFKAKNMLNEIQIYDKKTFNNSILSINKSKKDLNFLRLSRKFFSKTNPNPIDVSILEKSKNVVLKDFNVGWNDIGAWPAVHKVSKKIKGNNILKGKIQIDKVTDSIIKSENQQVIAINQNKIVVISTKDGLLIMPNDKNINIKENIEKLSRLNKEKVLYHPKVYRPWGSFEVLLTEEKYQVKRLIINPKQKISLQKHKFRSENWVIVDGSAKVTKNKKSYILKKNQSISIPKGAIHRVENIGLIPVIIIEVQSGEKLLENDIIRLEDIYNRD